MADPNMRVVWHNVIDSASIAASSEAGQLLAANLKSNLKGKAWRGLSTKASVLCGWEDSVPVGVVVLAFTNFTANATMQVRLYERADDMTPSLDTGPVLAAAAPPLGQSHLGSEPLGHNFYSRGGASTWAFGYGGYGVVWIPPAHACRRMEVIINDPDNPDGYLEVGRMIAGPWWSPEINFDLNHDIEPVDSSKSSRSAGGDLRTERGPKWRRISFSLSNMRSADRTAMLRLLREHGTSEPFFISLFPENPDTILEQSYQLWGKLEAGGKLSQPKFDIYATSVVVEEM